jgi:hypothetical protein
MVNADRERVRDLSSRLLRLHKVLLDRERRRYEDRHGAVHAGELFKLLLSDPQFLWLRSLSTMIANIDEIADADGPLEQREIEAVFRDAYRLLKSGQSGEFQEKYQEALQDSPEVVMAHAAVSKVLPAEGAPKAP